MAMPSVRNASHWVTVAIGLSSRLTDDDPTGTNNAAEAGYPPREPDVRHPGHRGRAPADDVDLRCGGEPLVAIGAVKDNTPLPPITKRAR
jgi:hypothetical protein